MSADPLRVRRVLALTLAVIALPVPAAHAADDETRIVVSRDPGLTGTQQADIRDDAGVDLQRRLPIARAEVVTAPAGDAQDALSALRSDPRVQWAQIDHVRSIASNDAYFSDQWALSNPAGGADIDAPEAWATGADGAGITVGVVDTGVDVAHADLTGRIAPAADRWDFVDNDATPQDANGHGTHIAGIIAATRDNSIGVSGVAPAAKILPVRVLDATGSGYDSAIALGLNWAATHGAQIVNASLGGAGRSDIIRNAIAAHPNTLFVVAAGNDHVNDTSQVTRDPCDAPYGNVLCVGATDDQDAPACFTNVGRQDVDLFAPGVGILSTLPGDHYGWMDGTSMATPMVAAVGALAMSHAGNSPPTGATLAAALEAAVDPIPGLESLSVTGGRIDALRAVGGTPADAGGPGGTWSPCAGDPAPTPSPSPSPTAGPAPATTPAATPAPSVDTDHDGKLDSADSCPSEPAATANGCPLPELRALKVSARHRRLSARVRADRVATITVRIERRTCRQHRCRYRRVASKRTSGRRTTMAKRVHRGRYRVTVRLASAAGHGATARRTVRLR